MFRNKSLLFAEVGVETEAPHAGAGGTEDVTVTSTAPPADDSRYKDLEARYTQLQQQMQQIRQQQTAPPTQQSQPDQQQLPSLDQINEAFWKNPGGVTTALTQRLMSANNNAVQQEINGVFESLAGTVRQQKASQHPDLFAKYGREIDEIISVLEPRFRANDFAWEQAIIQVKGKHIDELAEGIVNKRKPANGAPGLPGNTSAASSRSTNLSDDEVRVAKMFNLTNEEFAEGRKIYDNQPAAWDKVFTRDNTRGRGRAK